MCREWLLEQMDVRSNSVRRKFPLPVAGHQDDRQAWALRTGEFGKIQASNARHHYVGYEKVNAPTICLDELHCLSAVGSGQG
jgi:hypothetical protein